MAFQLREDILSKFIEKYGDIEVTAESVTQLLMFAAQTFRNEGKTHIELKELLISISLDWLVHPDENMLINLDEYLSGYDPDVFDALIEVKNNTIH